METIRRNTNEGEGPGLLKAWGLAIFILAVLVMAGAIIAGRGSRSSPVAHVPAPAATDVGTPEIPAATETPALVAAAPPEKDPAPVSYSDAETAYQSGRTDEAVVLFRAYSIAHPGNLMGHYMLGLALAKGGRNDEAETAFRSALELDPGHAKSLTNLARVILADGRAQEALGPASKAVEAAPQNGDAFRVRGRVYHSLGMTEPATVSYERAIALNENDVWALNNLGLLLIESARSGEAIAPLARAARLADDIACVHNNLGIALERSGRYGTAAEAYGRALKIDSAYGKAAGNLARVEILKEDPALPALDLAALAESYRVSVASDVEPTAPEAATAGTVAGDSEGPEPR